VCCVTTGTAFGFHWQVLKHEGSLFIGVALGADRVSASDAADVAQCARAMKFMAIGAIDEALVYAVVVGLREVGLRGDMTPVAQIWLRSRQQVLRFAGVVRRMAIQAANVIARMGRAAEVLLTSSVGVTRQATRAYLLPRQLLEANDLGDIASTCDVLSSRPMTRFASVPIQ
jgi:hypothetical protein